MGYGFVPPLEDEPDGIYCPGPCEHRDCAEVKRMRSTPCPICGQTFRFGEKVYLEKDDQDQDRYVHATCEWELVI